MKKLLLIAFILFSFVSFGQVFKVEYFDSLNVKIKKDVNFKKVTYEKIGKNFKVSTYEKGILSEARIYAADTLKWKNILQNIEYYQNGKVSKITTYKDFNTFNKEVATFYENGKKESVLLYEDKKDNNYGFLLQNYWDKNGTQKVIDGNGIQDIHIYSDLIISGTIKEGKQDGIWKTNTSKYPYLIEEYDNGVFKTGTRFLSEKDSVVYKELEVMASPKQKLINIGNHIQYYKSDVKEGKIVIEFYVDENGKIKNAQVIKGINPEFDKAFLNALYKSPDWNPSISRGEKIIQKYTRPFMFSINTEE